MSPVNYDLIQPRDQENLPKVGLQITYPFRGDIDENRHRIFLFGHEPQKRIRVDGNGRVNITDIFGYPIDEFTFGQKDSPIVIEDQITHQKLTLTYEPPDRARDFLSNFNDSYK